MELDKCKRSHIEPCHTEIFRHEGGFEWRFYGYNKAGNPICFVMKFERWWLSYLAKDLKKVLAAEWEELKHLTELVGFGS